MSEMFNEIKWFLIVVCLVVSINAAKVSDKKSPQKKATYLKPTKSPKSILEQFKDLPPDDLTFLREVDKQFKNHGNNIKIKVVKDNSTNSKNQKRTINGDLGYGYQNNQHSQGYYFSKPKFEVYPYSQEDIPPLTHHQQQMLYQKYGPPNYRPHEVLSNYKNQHYLPQQLHTSVEISPSHGYEIKQTNNGYETYSEPNYQQYNHNYRPISFQPEPQTGPVIVLRIPGPQKYATHLQMLLQQYLEIRAAEYIKLLQEQELQHQQAPQTQNYQQVPQTQNYQQYSYEPTSHGEQMYQNHYRQSYAQPSPQYQVQVQPAQIVYQKHQESTGDNSHPIHYSHEHVDSDQHDDDHVYNYQSTYRPEPSYPQHADDEEQYYQPDEYQHSSADDEEPHYVYPKIPSTTESSLQITENFPRDTHTHAYFTKATTKPSTYLSNHHQTYQDHAPETHYQTYQPQTYNSENVEYYYENQQEPDKDYVSASEQSVISITQKTPAPHNYHAHPTHAAHAGHGAHAHNNNMSADEHMTSKGTKRQTPTFTQEQYAKLNKLISRMKKKVTAVQKDKNE